VPLVGFAPLQLPEALQDTALVEDHVSVALCPAGIIGSFNDIVKATVCPPVGVDGVFPPDGVEGLLPPEGVDGVEGPLVDVEFEPDPHACNVKRIDSVMRVVRRRKPEPAERSKPLPIAVSFRKGSGTKM
jgi:hypothetical protein